MIPSQPTYGSSSRLFKRINDEKDVIHFRTKSQAYQQILTYIDLLCGHIHGTANKVLNHKYTLRELTFVKCAKFFDSLEKLCDETDLSQSKGVASIGRFGYMAFRDWFDCMKEACKNFVDNELAQNHSEQLKAELFHYISESFGNRMRIDYGTGHELYFIIFTMGLVNIIETQSGDFGSTSEQILKTTSTSRLASFVKEHGWDIHALFSHKYLRLCRRIQTKFRLEPAGSRGVYNMDDFQFLPFLFGAAQLSGVKYIQTTDFYLPEQVDMFKNDFIFFEAVDFILNNKRGPFNEHSYTLWCLTNLGPWESIYRRIKMKFTNDILGPFPIVQHFLFGDYVLIWDPVEQGNP